jgi:hypothetical protein
MTKPTIVYDTAIQQFQENRIFDHEFAAKFPGAEMWALLGKCAKERGWTMMTSDVYLRAPVESAVCISEMVTPYTKLLFKYGVIPSVILSGESPNVAWGFYRQLEKYTRPYHYAYIFRGAVSRVPSTLKVQPFHWPNALREPQPGPVWHNREYLVMVASNKNRYAVSHDKPFSRMRSVAKRILWDGLKLVDPLFKFEDLYEKRLDAIAYFSNVPGFRLYGTGWDKIEERSKYYQAVKRVGAVSISDKLATMTKFRYALCLENCIFPGYVTEKIFDCFFSGCIPVYWGAPDIADFVPIESFVDARQFGSFKDVDHFLQKMSSGETQRYLGAARDFLVSAAFEKFHQDFWVSELMKILEIEFTVGVQ